MSITKSGCQGTCIGRVLGAGYAVKCVNSTTLYNATMGVINGNGIPQKATIFNTAFNYGYYGRINFTALYVTNFALTGSANLTNRALQPATIDYPIKLVNDTITPDPSGSWDTDHIAQLRSDNEKYPSLPQRSDTHSGMAAYLTQAYDSNVVIAQNPTHGPSFKTNGSIVYAYIQNPNTLGKGGVTLGGVGLGFLSPTSDIMGAVREVAFRAAVQIPTLNVTSYYVNRNNNQDEILFDQTGYNEWKAATMQQILVEQVTNELVYKSQYIFLIIAVLFTLFATCTVLIIFNGWWRLGRDVSLSPIEVARAFAAPVLSGAGSNVEIKTLLKQLGNKELRWGAEVDQGAAAMRFDSAEKLEKPQYGQIFGR